MRSLIAPIVLALASSGCATDAYYLAVQEQTRSWERVEVARAAAHARKYDALAEFARTGDSHAQVAAVIDLRSDRYLQSPPPVLKDPSEDALRWTAIILPTATAITSGYFGYKLGVAQSDNSRLQTQYSYGAIEQGYQSMQAIATVPAPTPSNTTTTTTNYTLGAGSVGAWGGTASLDTSRRCTGTWTTYPSTGANPMALNAPFSC